MSGFPRVDIAFGTVKVIQALALVATEIGQPAHVQRCPGVARVLAQKPLKLLFSFVETAKAQERLGQHQAGRIGLSGAEIGCATKFSNGCIGVA
jgi:hypothetical protein